jgi:hypothetical protein
VRGSQRTDIRLHDRKLIPWSRTFRDKLPANQVPLLIPHFVEPIDSLLCYQQDRSTGSYRKPDEPSPYFRT